MKNNSLNALKRSHTVQYLSDKDFDILIIGGGITGAGIALDAASRGIKVALVEMQDFAAGTSSRSTKLIHGGLRYLKQLELGLVIESGRERAIAHKNASHLVIPEKLILPLKKGGTLDKFSTSVGLWVYDVLAGVKKEDRRHMLSKKEILKLEPELNPDGLIGGGIYAEYRTDDARLTLEVLKTASNYGATVLNYIQAQEFIYTDKKISSVICRDHISGETIKIKAKVVINASGPWVDEIRAIDNSLDNKHLHLTKGVHLVLDSTKLKINNSIYFEGEDKRMIFIIPREGKIYIGTTDTNYKGSKDNPQTNLKDCEYLLNAVNHVFPSAKLALNDIISSWAGLRPLIHEKDKPPSEISRKDEIFDSGSGLYSIAGGKLTAYRKMAERIINKVNKKHRLANTGSKTKKLMISGGSSASENELFINQIKGLLVKNNIDVKWSKYLWQRYGTNTKFIFDYINNNHQENIKLSLAELQYCIENESTYSLIDFLLRRNSRLLFYPETIAEIIQPIADKAQEILSLSNEEKKKQIENVKTYMKESISFE